MANRDEIVVSYSGRVEEDATFSICFTPYYVDETVYPKGIWYHYKIYGPTYANNWAHLNIAAAQLRVLLRFVDEKI